MIPQIKALFFQAVQRMGILTDTDGRAMLNHVIDVGFQKQTYFSNKKLDIMSRLTREQAFMESCAEIYCHVSLLEAFACSKILFLL